MDLDLDKAYKFAPLDRYSFKERLLIRLAEKVFYVLIALVGRSLRYEVEGQENIDATEGKGSPVVIAVWHNRLFAGTYFLRNRKWVVMASKSFDGEYIARFIQRFGFGAARGSSSRGGRGALEEMTRLVEAGRTAAFTVDGPRGPRYEAKIGPCVLSKRTGAPMVPLSIEVSSYWEVKSWDRLQIPKPFSRVKVYFGEPIAVPSDASEEEVEAYRIKLQTALDSLVEKGRLWRAGQGDK